MLATGNITGYFNIFVGWKSTDWDKQKKTAVITKKEIDKIKCAVCFQNISANFKSSRQPCLYTLSHVVKSIWTYQFVITT